LRKNEIEEEIMTKLGHYITLNGERFDCIFYEENNIAVALGPIDIFVAHSLPEKIKIEVFSEDEAKKELAKELGPGDWAKKN
jgi:hypothetical protein